MRGVSRGTPFLSILRIYKTTLGLKDLKACHYVGTQLDGIFEAYGVFVFVHVTVSLCFKHG